MHLTRFLTGGHVPGQLARHQFELSEILKQIIGNHIGSEPSRLQEIALIVFLRPRRKQQPGRTLVRLVPNQQHRGVDILLQEMMPQTLAIGVRLYLLLHR
jgi:hypothetical protein